MQIKSTGGIITAKDIICPSEFKILNPDLYICSVQKEQNLAWIYMQLLVEVLNQRQII